MVDNIEITRINKLTFKELRNELANCKNNPVRETLIRNLMYIRYNQHLHKKQQLIQLKKEHKKKQISKIKNKLEEKYKRNGDALNFDDEIDFNENDFKTLKPPFEPLNELDKTDELFDSRDITEYDRDYANNNLIERLNIDADLRKIKPKFKNKNDFMTPYSNDSGGNYAPFNDNSRSQKNNFSNIKFNKNDKLNK
jgi:hypothetical protein